MTSPSTERVLEALSTVPHPEAGRDVVDLNMIGGVAIRGGNVQFALQIDDPAKARALEPLRQACERAVLAIPGVVSATAVMTAEREAPHPRPSSRPGTGPTPAAPKPLAPGIRRIIAVASGKGGVGKSTVSVNLALGLLASGLRVGLLDADIYGPSVPRMLGLAGRPGTSEDGKKLRPMTAFGLKVMSMGFLVDEEAPMIWRGPMVQSALQQLMGDVLWGELDVLVVDMPPGTGDAQLTMAQRTPLAGAVIVSTPQDIALLDARKAINMFKKVNVPVLGVVENMAYFCCPACGHRSEIFGYGGARATAEAFGVDFLGEVPLQLAIRETSDAGRPVVATAPEGAEAAAFRAVARLVRAKLEGGSVRPFPRIVHA